MRENEDENNQSQTQIAYTKPLDAVLSDLKADPDMGLSWKEAEKRTIKFGWNKLPEPQKDSLLKLFFKQFQNFMIYILLGAVGLSLALADYKDAILISIVIIINACIGFFQEYKAEKAMASLRKMANPKAQVLRDGQIKEVATESLVPGDIVLLEEGDVIPADMRLVESVGLEVNEALLTGESFPAEKDAQKVISKKVPLGEQFNMAFMGTTISGGNGRGVIVATGINTQIGKIAQTLAIPIEKPTPLEKNLAKLGRYLVVITIFVSAGIAGIGLLQGREWEEMLFTAISLAVAVIPEGLVAVVTITMAVGVQRMAKRNAIVRNLPAVETLGAVDTICSDKTGTLTEGRMTATDLWVKDTLYAVSGTGVDPKGEIYANDRAVQKLPAEAITALEVLALCNNAVLQQDKKGTWEGVGDPTEVALQVLAHKLGIKREQLEKHWEFIEGISFDNERKKMSVIYKSPQKKVFILTKGAPEEIFSVCSNIPSSSPLKQINIDMAERGLRVLAVAIREIDSLEKLEKIEPELLEKNMTFLGMVGLLDAPRPEAKQAVLECLSAGIRVIMITGDHPATAKNIATQLGIFNPKKDRFLTGQEMDRMSEEQLCSIKPFPTVFARVSPENKLTLVKALRKMGSIVAMTGDGVNDAAAIKHSNVGVAMGQAGTDVTKQAADIVLSDDNFATIVAAVEEGRRIFHNIKKFIRYLLSCNLSNVGAILFATIAGVPLPFTPIQILWLNLVTDTPPALALGFDPADKNSMNTPPRDPKKGIFKKRDVIFILYHGLTMSALMLGVFLIELYLDKGSLEKARTMGFAMLVLTQLAHAFNARSTTQSFINEIVVGNKKLIGAVLFSFTLLLAGIYLPILKDVFGQVELSWQDWAELGAGVFIFILLSEVFKLFTRKGDRTSALNNA